MARISYKEQALKLRENAILDVVNRFLGERGYDAMTVDAIAAEVGVAKASLYKHFDSKESLAAAAMIRLLDRALVAVAALPATMPADEQLRATLRWALTIRLEGGLPLLPSVSPMLRASLLANADYLGPLLALNERLMALVERARADGTIDDGLPSDVSLFTIYASTCNPSVDYLRMTGNYTDSEIIEFTIATCFGGLVGQKAGSAPESQRPDRHG